MLVILRRSSVFELLCNDVCLALKRMSNACYLSVDKELSTNSEGPHSEMGFFGLN